MNRKKGTAKLLSVLLLIELKARRIGSKLIALALIIIKVSMSGKVVQAS
jgi:hypothetical protein